VPVVKATTDIVLSAVVSHRFRVVISSEPLSRFRYGREGMVGCSEQFCLCLVACLHCCCLGHTSSHPALLASAHGRKIFCMSQPGLIIKGDS